MSITTFALWGCSGESSHPPFYDVSKDDAGTFGYDTNVNLCATPGKEGCPCTDSGAVVECGRIANVSGDYITCNMGYATLRRYEMGAVYG